jgi:hypothetical protein
MIIKKEIQQEESMVVQLIGTLTILLEAVR